MPSNISEKISGGSFQYAEMHAGYTQGIKPNSEGLQPLGDPSGDQLQGSAVEIRS